MTTLTKAEVKAFVEPHTATFQGYSGYWRRSPVF